MVVPGIADPGQGPTIYASQAGITDAGYSDRGLS
jgi:hypothetical protein